MKITSEDFTKLVGPDGERFTREAEWREPKRGEYYITEESQVSLCPHDKWTPSHIVLTLAKTAREWLSEWDAPGWREEALEYQLKEPSQPYHLEHKNGCPNLSAAIRFHLPNWDTMPSGDKSWEAVLTAIVKGTSLPPHPSTVKPTLKRLEVFASQGYFRAGGEPLTDWLCRADFRGFVYAVHGADDIRGFAIGWLDSDGVLHDQPMGSHCHPVRPVAVFVEVAE